MTDPPIGTDSLFTTVCEPKPFIAFCKYVSDENGKETNDFQVFLVNSAERTYPYVLVYTGMFGDGLDFPPNGITDKGPLKPFSEILLDGGNVATLDFIAWFRVNLITRDNNVLPMDFSFGKLREPDYEKNLQYISQIRMDGIILPLEERQ